MRVGKEERLIELRLYTVTDYFDSSGFNKMLIEDLNDFYQGEVWIDSILDLTLANNLEKKVMESLNRYGASAIKNERFMATVSDYDLFKGEWSEEENLNFKSFYNLEEAYRAYEKFLDKRLFEI